jgi:pimeloyl-ACP methyl ester carboxylesterase
MTGIIKRAFYDAPKGQVHYRYILTDVEEKKAPVVFLHQSASCGWAYQSMMKEYALRGHDCYAPDMPGCVYHNFVPNI